MAGLALLALAIAVTAWLSIDLTRVRGGVSAIWVSNGLLLGALMRVPRSSWPLPFALAFAVNVAVRVLHDDAWVTSVGLSAINLLETWVMATAIRRRVPDVDDPARLLALSRVGTLSAVAACLLGATLSAGLLALVEGGDFARIWITWFSAHLLGMVIVATLVVLALHRNFPLFGLPGRRLDLLLCVLALLAVCVLVFAQHRYPLLFLVYLPLLLLTYRHGLPGVVMGILVVAPASGIAAALGRGPFQLVANGSLLEHALLGQAFVGACVLLSLPTALVLTASRRLERKVRENETRYRLLADHAQDIVMRIRRDGSVAYASPSVRDILGWETGTEAAEAVHPDDRALRDAGRERLWRDGGDSSITYRVRHRDGHDVWLEVVGSRIAGENGQPEIVLAGRDVSARVAAEDALRQSRQQLQSLIDGIPAGVMYVDAEQRYGFANAAVRDLLGTDPQWMVGRTVREVRGEEAYSRLAPHVADALRGNPQSFEGAVERDGRHRDHQIDYVPDLSADGKVQGFYALTTDITPLKDAERALEQLTREDALTGLANRREFEQRLEQAVARARRLEQPIALMLLDVDHFKQINDAHGHPAGDAVLRAVAERIRASVYDVDLPVRLGGDEFAVLVEYAPGVREASVAARRILEAMQQPVALPGGGSVRAGTSIGVGFQREPGDGAALVALADQALYAAKQAGRGTYRVLRD